MNRPKARTTKRPLPKRTGAAKKSSFTPNDLSMFKRHKVPMALVTEGHIRRVTDTQARQLPAIAARRDQNLQGIVFPYIHAETEEVVTFRIRRDHPEMKNGKSDGKYICPKGGQRTLYVHPRSASRLKDLRAPVVLVESEKAVLALLALSERTKNKLIPIGMGGCYGWSQEKRAIPALLQACKEHPVRIMLDSNVATNNNVREAQDALAAELSTAAYACPEVLIASLPQLEGVNGPDDLIALENGDDLLLQALEAATPAVLGSYSDDDLALRFTGKHGDDLRYVDKWGQWVTWECGLWRRDETLSVYDKARKICREAADRCGKKQTAQRIRSAQTVAAVERLARADRKHAATIEQWDLDSWALNTPDGIVDLRTGKIRPATREDYCTKITAVPPGGDCPLWRKVLREVTAGDKELQKYMQRMFGYILTGVTYEHAMFFFYGSGANGKSVVLNTIFGLLGDYAKCAPIETFTASHNETHPTDLAGLQGARLVIATETKTGGGGPKAS